MKKAARDTEKIEEIRGQADIVDSEAVIEQTEGSCESTAAASAAESQAELVDPQARIDELNQMLQQSKEDYLRLAAEFDNYRKRTTREIGNLLKNANERLIVDLIGVLDDFERAFRSREENQDSDAYHKGVRLIYDKLDELLIREGLQKFESVGKKFDARLHDAMMHVEVDGQEPDTVAAEFQSGYSLNDKVVRHAKVSVAKGKSES